MAATARTSTLGECVPENAMTDPGEIARFYDRCTDLMRELLDGLAAAPDQPRPFPEIEDAIGWPRRRIASVLGGVCHLRRMEFDGRRPYHFHDPKQAASRRWEIWMDGAQARAVRAEQTERSAAAATSLMVVQHARVASPGRNGKKLSMSCRSPCVAAASGFVTGISRPTGTSPTGSGCSGSFPGLSTTARVLVVLEDCSTLDASCPCRRRAGGDGDAAGAARDACRRCKSHCFCAIGRAGGNDTPAVA